MKVLPMDLNELSDDALLALRFCDLPLDLQHSEIQPLIHTLYEELKTRNIVIRPPCYFADEWFSPEGEPIIAVPFYLGHPRLKRLEQKWMHEVEGGSADWALKLLRHETGHAIMHAYCLERRSKTKTVFGKAQTYNPDAYTYRLYSKSYVRHLDDGYAQSHPDEDFAESFAVWLDPHSDWKTRYRNWPALKKLSYIDEVIQSIAGKTPLRTQAHFPYACAKSKKRLKTHYQQKHKLYQEDLPDFWDRDLQRLFVSKPDGPVGTRAYQFLQQHQKSIVQSVCAWSPMPKYTAEKLLRDLLQRARALNLYLRRPETETQLEIVAYLSVLISNMALTGRYKGHSR